MAQASVDRFGFLLSDVARLYRAAFEREIAKSGLGVTPGEARALVRIAAINGMRQSEIAVALGIEPMTLSRYVDGLEKAGLVERQADPRDGRAKCVSTTEKAEDVLAAILAHADDLVTRLQANLAESDRQALNRALKTMRDNLARL
ncbi:MAG: MarR family transcriptional regulator [Martelella sp.]|uniref:MarR family winged helix-turn-helix transcriptional regulator n=1 Tax=unclassified Martelella TaxID=2629616 RepID=UPI000C4A48ED|nr:MarR family transcriptional regulator [Martelella sp.]MAU22608.1 MarR family transcriptional regulator [Martelella sp.]|tara:strand:+ start:779 stop:1216 length:438 start_codon:yes stop_codon:yes gene_type:complete